MYRSFKVRGKCILGCVLMLAVAAPLDGAGAKIAETVLYRFQGGGDGANPYAGVITDTKGYLYGTTEYGGGSGCGNLGCGTVFRLDLKNGTETQLWSFEAGSDGEAPLGTLIMDAKGNLYGTTEFGGAGGAGCGDGNGCGTVFEIGTNKTERILYSFGGFNGDGSFPYAGLLSGSNGDFYGTTRQGGSDVDCGINLGCGAVFELDPKNGKESVLYSFCSQPNCSDGIFPESVLIEDKKSNLYGTASAGGNQGCGGIGCGVIFEILFGKDTESVLYTFPGGTSGATPTAGLLADSAGNFYGTTSAGGSTTECDDLGCGTTFERTANGKQFHYRVKFAGGKSGANPMDSLIMDGAGNLYGTTYSGGGTGCGGNGCGTVFMVPPKGKVKQLYAFQGENDGANPVAGLIMDSQGNLYGTTYAGGSTTDCFGTGCGTVFEITMPR
jgi:uncharacterized repeat protein (TIGR03803 family)